MIYCLILPLLISSTLLIIFFFFSKKTKWDAESFNTFECGFTSYHFSREPFSIHFFILGLVFLFLDLELCLIMPFFNEFLYSLLCLSMTVSFLSVLLIGLIVEWVSGFLDWQS